MKRFISMWSLAAMIAIVAGAQPADAATLESAIDSISDRVEDYLREKNQLKINIGEFNGPIGTSSGRNFRNRLEAELKSRNINIEPFSQWEIRGDFQVNTEGEFATVQVITRLVNARGEEVAGFRQRVQDSIDNLKDVLDISQATVDLESPALASEETETPVVASTEPATTTENPQPTNDSAAGGNSTNGTPVNGTPANSTPPASNNAVASDTPPVTTNPAQAGNSTQGGSTPPVTGNSVAGSTPPVTPVPNNSSASGNSVAGGNPVVGGNPVAGGTVAGGGASNSGVAIQDAALPSSVDRDRRIVESLQNGGFHQINESTIAASQTSPYHVQIKVERPGSPAFPIPIRPVGNGLAFCELQDGDFYSVIITNTAPHDVGVELMIDGINSLVFSDDQRFLEHGKWIIRGTNNNGGVPYSARFSGWYKNPQQVFRFRVGQEPEAVASELGRPQKIGTITATFYGAWVGDDVHPLEAKLLAEKGLDAGRSIGTSRGPIQQESSEVLERKFGRFPLASVSIRYINPDPPSDLPLDQAP